MRSPVLGATFDCERVLIVNADDFGMSRGVNDGIIEAHTRGIVTSASLMVRRHGAAHAVSLAMGHPRLSVGLHVDLGEWDFRHGEWRLRKGMADVDDRAAVEREVDAQIHRFRSLTDREPTHLDSHQHVHRVEPVRSVLREWGLRIGIPVRGLSEGVITRGDFYGRDGRGPPCPEMISAHRLAQIISSIPVGVTELGCHPGDPTDLVDDYRAERRLELEALCDPLVRQTIGQHGICLASYNELLPGREAVWPGR